jgi:hypothetical protein
LKGAIKPYQSRAYLAENLILLKGGVVMGCYGGGDGEAAILFLILILLVIGTMGFGY